MLYRLLGASKLSVSAISFGCMSLKDERDAARVIDHAVEAGINFFDTADLYEKGVNEEWVGRILRSRREEVLLATKVGNQWREDTVLWAFVHPAECDTGVCAAEQDRQCDDAV